jgi:hypothetical protein
MKAEPRATSQSAAFGQEGQVNHSLKRNTRRSESETGCSIDRRLAPDARSRSTKARRIAYTTCDKFRNPSADGPGLPCLDGVRHNDLLTTTDGGKTFKVMTLPTPPGSSQ